MGFNLLTGEALMCLLVVADLRESADIHRGIDIFAQRVGDEDDPAFFENNSGRGKMFSGGPTCFHKGMEIPCFVWFSPNGSMRSEILTEVI